MRYVQAQGGVPRTGDWEAAFLETASLDDWPIAENNPRTKQAPSQGP